MLRPRNSLEPWGSPPTASSVPLIHTIEEQGPARKPGFKRGGLGVCGGAPTPGDRKTMGCARGESGDPRPLLGCRWAVGRQSSCMGPVPSPHKRSATRGGHQQGPAHAHPPLLCSGTFQTKQLTSISRTLGHKLLFSPPYIEGPAQGTVPQAPGWRRHPWVGGSTLAPRAEQTNKGGERRSQK